MADKYKSPELPKTKTEAISMANDRELWAKEARSKDLHGTAYEWELTAKLLVSYASWLHT